MTPGDHAHSTSGFGLFLSGSADEASYRITEIDGALPAWLRGTYYINGPARFEVGHLRYRHWLDGDGMVCSLRFSDEGVRFTSRFISTRKRVEETRAQRALFRTFGTTFDGDRLRRNMMIEPPVNISVYPYAGSVLAFGEQTLPMEIDPVTLETRGAYDFHGALNDMSPFAAHAKFAPSGGRVVNFGVGYGAVRSTLHIYEFDHAGHKVFRNRAALDAPYSIHDMGLTDRFAIFHVGTYVVNVETLLSGKSVLESLDYDANRQSRLLLAPREKRAPLRAVQIEGGYCLHFINCFERGDRLFVDVVDYDRPLYPQYAPLPTLLRTVSKGRPLRYEVNLSDLQVVDRVELSYDLAPDFPSVSPASASREYTEFWCLGISAREREGDKFYDQLARISWEGAPPDVWQAPAGVYLGGEPVCVPSPGGSAGVSSVVIIQSYQIDSGAARFLLFDAGRISAGPIAAIGLQSKICPGFHASFHPA